MMDDAGTWMPWEMDEDEMWGHDDDDNDDEGRWVTEDGEDEEEEREEEKDGWTQDQKKARTPLRMWGTKERQN